MTLDDTLSEIEKQWPLELKEAQPASATKRLMELSVCPFCGAVPRWMEKNDYGALRWWIACPCGIELSTAWVNKLEASAIWNRRLNSSKFVALSSLATKWRSAACRLRKYYAHEYITEQARQLDRCADELDQLNLSERGNSSNAAGASSPKDSLSPEIVIPASNIS